MRTGTLCQRRGTDIAGQYIRIPVHFQTAGLGRILRVVPGTRRQHNDTRAYPVGYCRSGERSTAIVEDAHDVAIVYVTCSCICRIDTDRFTALDLCVPALASEVVLTVQTRLGLIRIERERISSGPNTADEFLFIQPHGMAAAVAQPERRQSIGKNLHLARWGI